MHDTLTTRACLRIAVFSWIAIFVSAAFAQDRLKTMPGYEQYQKMSPLIPNSVKSGALDVTWKDDGKSFEYTRDGKRFHYDIDARQATPHDDNASPASIPTRGRRGQGGGIARGRQAASVLSPDGKLKAFYRDRNLWLSDSTGVLEMPITADGSEKNRLKYGIASWVYGEELVQRSAMWWSPDGSKIAYYRFDESKVPDYFLQLNQTRLQDSLDVEAYPRPGDPNPIVDLYIYDLHSKTTTRIDVRDGKPFDDSVVGHYVYHVSWTQDGSELLLYRANRRQNAMEFAAADPATGKCRVIVREKWPASWVVDSPTMQFLKDGKRFIWASERTGWKNFWLFGRIRG
jgi:dipeptidyl-peptidase-4